jgi:hypothetical protein
MAETKDSLGNVVSRTRAPHPDFPYRSGGIPSGGASHVLHSPQLVADLDDREKALGQRYMRDDRKTFTEEIADHHKRNPHLPPQQAARDVMRRRQQIEAANDPKERELVLALQDPTRKREIMARIRHGLSPLPENK